MKRLPLIVLLAAAASCREAPSPASDAAMVDFAEKSGDYRCRAPADWRVLEDPVSGKDVMFFGPDRVSISIGKYPDASGQVKTPEDYWRAAKASGPVGAMETTTLGGRTIYRLHQELPVRAPNSPKILYVRREDMALIPAPGGFYAVEHRAPVESYQATLPAFEALVLSLKPGR